MVKTQKCENGQNAKMWNWSKSKNVKTVKTQKCENGNKTLKCENGQNAKKIF